MPDIDPIPDLNLFMMCGGLNRAALSRMPVGYHTRCCRPDELGLWMGFPFDTPEDAARGRGYMERYFEEVYAPRGDLFFQTCRFVCGADDVPVATCFAWRAYGSFTTIHWFKALKSHEGRGIGRALLSEIMVALPPAGFPVFLHTQPSSYRAIHLYADFGFALLQDPVIGQRRNQLNEALPYLRQYMPREYYGGLAFAHATAEFLAAAAAAEGNQF